MNRVAISFIISSFCLNVANGQQISKLFANRTGEQRKQAVLKYGGTKESEEAVERGLKWIIRQQRPDGSWNLSISDYAIREEPAENITAGTAFGLLPLLSAGYTHKPRADNPYDKAVSRGLQSLMRQQDMKTGFFGRTMYQHAMATCALCEAYGMTQDPALRKSAQMAVDLIVKSQGNDGGWRYTPMKAPAGDTCIGGWQISVLTTAKAVGLAVPENALKKADGFLEGCHSINGFAYTAGGGATPRMTAVGVLCRQKLNIWGPNHPAAAKAVAAQIVPVGDPKADVYFNHFATQVMFNYDGKAWKEWNASMRDFLVKGQVTEPFKAANGSWAPGGDPFGRSGGRMMMTSMNLLTLQVYYRYPPLFPGGEAE